MNKTNLILALSLLVTTAISKATADTRDLTGVYEGTCTGVNEGKPYKYRMSIKGTETNGITGIVEYRPIDREIAGSCGGYTIKGARGFSLIGKSPINLNKIEWIYYNFPNKKTASKLISQKIKFIVDGRAGEGDELGSWVNFKTGFDNCSLLSLNRVSSKYTGNINFSEKKSCQSGEYHKLNIDISELKLGDNIGKVLEVLKSNEYPIEESENTPFLDIISKKIVGIKKNGINQETRIALYFSIPSHGNRALAITKSQVFRVPKSSQDKRPPTLEEVRHLLRAKYGEPKTDKLIKDKAKNTVGHYTNRLSYVVCSIFCPQSFDIKISHKKNNLGVTEVIKIEYALIDRLEGGFEFERLQHEDDFVRLENYFKKLEEHFKRRNEHFKKKSIKIDL